jgi:hypothetical protein
VEQAYNLSRSMSNFKTTMKTIEKQRITSKLIEEAGEPPITKILKTNTKPNSTNKRNMAIIEKEVLKRVLRCY